MGGPIVRLGTTPEFWNNWDRIFGGSSKAKKKSNSKKKSSAKANKSATAKKSKKKKTKK